MNKKAISIEIFYLINVYLTKKGVIPKSTNEVHIKENIDIFDFTLEKTDMDNISLLNKNLHLCWNPDIVQ